MTVFIGIVTYHSLDDLPGCLAGIHAQSIPDAVCIVLDNASGDPVAAWLAEHAPEVRLIQNRENFGFGRAHNQIIAACEVRAGDYYLALNPDVRMEPGYLESLIAAFREPGADRVGWATGKLRLSDDSDRLYSAGHALLRNGYAFNIGYGQADDGGFDVPRRVFGAPGAAALYSGALIADLSDHDELFDAAMFMYGEDVDLDWRAGRAGWTCAYVPDARASHRGSAPGERLRTHALANRYLSVLKNASWPDLLTLHLMLIPLHCLIRLLITPRQGTRLVGQIVRHAPQMISKRRSPRVSRKVMDAWFAWSSAQSSGQPITWAQRFRARMTRHAR